MREVELRDAAIKLSALTESASRGQPSIIPLNGRREAVLVSYKEWERLSRIPSFGRLLMEAPLEPGDLPERRCSGGEWL